MIKVIINGAKGKMGRTTVQAIAEQPDLQLVAALGRDDDLGATIDATQADVVVDFTLPDCVFSHTQTIIKHNARPVIGTSGLTPEQIEQLQQACQQQKLGGIIAPNFSLGAILMMRYAQDAAKYLPHAEIIEFHHEQKVDAPSGTATKTADLMAKSRLTSVTPIPQNAPARGDSHHDIPVHSVRLPGVFAQQLVMFGGEGETLTIRHDSHDRNCMMPGVFSACRKVMTLDHLVYGLEHILD